MFLRFSFFVQKEVKNYLLGAIFERLVKGPVPETSRTSKVIFLARKGSDFESFLGVFSDL